NLQAGFELFLKFAEDCGAIAPADRKSLSSRCWKALRDAAAAQTKFHAASEPTAQFLITLRSLLIAGRAYLEARGGGYPQRGAGSCGWRRESDRWSPLGQRIGWVDGDAVYLE